LHALLPALQLDDWHATWACASKAGYSGVALLSRQPPLNVTCGINRPEHDDEGRVITAVRSP
jgi:exonuclease III